MKLEGVIGFYFRDSTKAPEYKAIMLVFKGKVVGNVLPEAQNEVQNVKFATIDEIQSLPLRFDIVKIIEDYRQNKAKNIPVHHFDIST